jgi:PKD repeat protein
VYVPEHGTVNLEFTLTRSPSVLPLPGYTNPPTDPDGDGLYEDLNGNGFADWDDAVVLFWNTDWIQEHEPVTAFDYNHNGFIDWDDAVVLFWEV